ncbi:MAG TPA: transposase [Gaiellaceae bacterium]|nr:transposase [Gaiellaceae bacterium]
MTRRPREDHPGGIHHAIAKGNAGAAIVRDDVDRELLVKRIGKTVERHRWSCLAYCLLDTHVHLLIGTPRANLSQGMQWLLGPYAQNFNARHEREGHLFRGRFYSKPIRSQNHLVSALIYIALNPVRAGIADQPETWSWSSYSATVGRGDAPEFLDVAAALELVHADPESARVGLRLGAQDAIRFDAAAPRT